MTWSAEINPDDQIVRIHRLSPQEPAGAFDGYGWDLMALGGICLLVAGLWLLCWVLA